MGGDGAPGVLVDDRPHVGLQAGRVPDAKLRHGAGQHLGDGLGDVLLHVEQAQGGAALPGALEGGGRDVLDRLLGQGRGIDDHGVQAAGLGDQGGGMVAGQDHGPADGAGHGRGPGETDPGDPRVRGERRAHALAVAGQELERRHGHTGCMKQAGRLRGDQRGLLSGLCEHRVPDRERGRDLAAEDGQGEVPGG